MSTRIPDSSNNGREHWNVPGDPPVPLAVRESNLPKTEPRSKAHRLEQWLSRSLGSSSDENREIPSLKERSIKNSQGHIKEVSKLFKSSMALKKSSHKEPLAPFNPESDNANDVYMTDFKIAHQKNLDVVFKPGLAAATRSKICYGLTILFKELEKVIVPAKEGQATVVSREDYQRERVKIHNPEANCSYIVDKDQLEDQFRLEAAHTQKSGIIEGRVGTNQVELSPVEGRPGFYFLKVVDKDSALRKGGFSAISEEGESSSITESEADEEEEWDDDGSLEDVHLARNELHSLETSNQSEEELSAEEPIRDAYVMRISSAMPSRIDALVQDGASWSLFHDEKGASYLVTGEAALKVYNTAAALSEEMSESISEAEDFSEESSTEELPDIKEHYVAIGDIKYSLSNSPDGNLKFFPLNPPLKKPLADDPKEIASRYLLLSQEEGRFQLVPKEVCVAYNEGEDTVQCDGKEYEVEMGDEDDTFQLKPVETPSESFIVLDKEDEWLQSDALTRKGGQEYVSRNEQDYRVTTDAKGISRVVGENIQGMVQLKVENIFQKPKGETRTLDLLEPSAAREEFYKRIDMTGFTQAFIATVLLRPQDGKIIDLGESNVLFQALPDANGNIDPQNPHCKLRPIIIDLDETMPPANDYTQDPEYMKAGKHIHAVRNGFMGFPQARKKLTGEAKISAEKSLREVIDQKKAVEDFLQKFVGEGTSISFNQNHVKAYKEVVDRLEVFLGKHKDHSWSLQELFFFVFPEYAQQWKALGDMAPERKSMHIGKNTVEKALGDIRS